MMRRIAALVGLIVFAMPAVAAEYLSPEPSPFSGDLYDFEADYYARLLLVFKQAYNDDVVARVMVLPSFTQEEVIGIQKGSDGFKVFALKPEVQIWGFATLPDPQQQENDGLHSSIPAKLRDVKVSRCERPIESALATRIVAVWKAVLLGTRYSENTRIGLDGTSFHFSMRDGFNEMAGAVWSPQPPTNPALLADVAFAMKSYCGTNNARSVVILESKVDELEKQLVEEP